VKALRSVISAASFGATMKPKWCRSSWSRFTKAAASARSSAAPDIWPPAVTITAITLKVGNVGRELRGTEGMAPMADNTGLDDDAAMTAKSRLRPNAAASPKRRAAVPREPPIIGHRRAAIAAAFPGRTQRLVDKGSCRRHDRGCVPQAKGRLEGPSLTDRSQKIAFRHPGLALPEEGSGVRSPRISQGRADDPKARPVYSAAWAATGRTLRLRF